jgi:DNA-binding SARP family transcriptional activator
MLGPVRVRHGEGWVPVPAQQQRVVLAVLLADAGGVVGVDHLVDAVWGDRPPRRAVNTAQAYVMRLRRLLGDDAIVTVGRGYELVGGGDVDAIAFERTVAAARRELDAGKLEPGAARLERALALWQGNVFADVPDSPLLWTRVAQLEQLRHAAEEDHLAVLLQLGKHCDAAERLDGLVREIPLRERRWELLMRALDACGRRAEALMAFQRARGVLRDELGIEPGPRLRHLQRAVLDGNPADSAVLEMAR